MVKLWIVCVFKRSRPNLWDAMSSLVQFLVLVFKQFSKVLSVFVLLKTDRTDIENIMLPKRKFSRGDKDKFTSNLII